MSSKKRTVLNNVKIFDIANKGQAIAKFNERVILVDKGVPGDICDILVTKKRRKFWKGKIVKRIKDSEHRIEAKCKHFGICGGCKWQNMKYDSQLYFKQKEVFNNLKRIGGVEFENTKLLELIPSKLAFLSLASEKFKLFISLLLKLIASKLLFSKFVFLNFDL